MQAARLLDSDGLDRHDLAGRRPWLTRTDLVSGTRSNGLFAAPDHLLFWRDGTLMAQPFDPDRLQLRGNPQTLPGSAGLNRLTNQGLFSVSGTGTLALFGGAVRETRLEWVDRSGRRIGTPGPTGLFNSLSLAPDDRGSPMTRQTRAREASICNVWTLRRASPKG